MWRKNPYLFRRNTILVSCFLCQPEKHRYKFDQDSGYEKEMWLSTLPRCCRWHQLASFSSYWAFSQLLFLSLVAWRLDLCAAISAFSADLRRITKRLCSSPCYSLSRRSFTLWMSSSGSTGFSMKISAWIQSRSSSRLRPYPLSTGGRAETISIGIP